MLRFTSILVIILAGTASSLFAAPPETRVVIGVPQYAWVGNNATVTMELKAGHTWDSKSQNAVHTFVGGTPPAVIEVDMATLTVTDDAFGAAGIPTPGDGPKIINFSFDVENGWDWRFEVTMNYKENGVVKPIGDVKRGKAVKPPVGGPGGY